MTGTMEPEVAALPAEPASEVEWEELLVRVEVAPRALRLAVDDGAADAAGVRDALRRAFQWEARVHAALCAMAGAALPNSADTAAEAGGAADAVAAIARLRTRSFAMVQRRGLEVWRWRAPDGPLQGATAYQLLAATVEHDRRTLAAVRAAGREE